MTKRLRNNLSKRRTRKNTLRRKRIKKYTRGGKPFPFNPFRKKRGTTNSLESPGGAGEWIMGENTKLKDVIEQYKSVLDEKNKEIKRLTQEIIDIKNIMASE